MKKLLPIRHYFIFFCLFLSVLSGAQETNARQGQPNQAVASHSALPGYLRPVERGEQMVMCFNELPVRSAEECDQLSVAILRAKGLEQLIESCIANSWKSANRLKCVGLAMGFPRVSGQARKQAVNAISSYRKTLAAEYIKDQEDKRAIAGGAVSTTTFDIAGQAFTLPNSMRIPTKADYTGIRLWTNLVPDRACPETGFVLLNFENLRSGDHPFHKWSHAKRWPGVGNILKKTFSGLHGDTRVDWVCRSGSPEVVFYFLDNGKSFGTLPVPAIDNTGWGETVNFVITNFDRRMLEYTNKFTEYKQ